jgi:hypothetical protein
MGTACVFKTVEEDADAMSRNWAIGIRVLSTIFSTFPREKAFQMILTHLQCRSAS